MLARPTLTLATQPTAARSTGERPPRRTPPCIPPYVLHTARLPYCMWSSPREPVSSRYLPTLGRGLDP